MKRLIAMGRSDSKGGTNTNTRLFLMNTLFLGKKLLSETDVYISYCDDFNLCRQGTCLHDDKVMTDIGNYCFKTVSVIFSFKFDFFAGFWTRTRHLNCVFI